MGICYLSNLGVSYCYPIFLPTSVIIEMNNYAYPSIIIKVTIPLLLLQEFWSKLPKKCRHWSTSILSQVLLCSSRSILNPRIFFVRHRLKFFCISPLVIMNLCEWSRYTKHDSTGSISYKCFFIPICNYAITYLVTLTNAIQCG